MQLPTKGWEGRFHACSEGVGEDRVGSVRPYLSIALIGHLPGSVASCCSCDGPALALSPDPSEIYGVFAAIEEEAESEYQPETGAAEPQWRNFSASISILTGLLRKSSIPA